MQTTQNSSGPENPKEQKVRELTSYLLHKHYCENDGESIIRLLDNQLSWLGAGEDEYAVDYETVAKIFRMFAGMIPKCTISDEEYHVIELSPEVYLCTGRAWIATDPSSNMYLRVHQRITTVFRWTQDEPRCCHIHISNPYSEMSENDIGFPTKMGQQSYEYLQECITEQKKLIEAQTAMLERMSYEDSLTGLFNRNKFNHIIDSYDGKNKTSLGVACFDINGLKEVNDSLGHNAGDDLIFRTAKHISRFFPGKTFRIGGDEFAVIDDEAEENAFRTAVSSVCSNMEKDGLSCSVGLCWRSFGCNILEQFDEADKLMYQAKSQFYSMSGNDRRRQ